MGTMKKQLVAGIFALLLLLTGCSLWRESPETKTVTTTYEGSAGMTLHVDTTVRTGAISVRVTDENGTVYYDERLVRSFDCGINLYRKGVYTVTAAWEEACGDVEVYLTQTENGGWPVFSYDGA